MPASLPLTPLPFARRSQCAPRPDTARALGARLLCWLLACGALLPGAAQAASLDGAALGLWWGVPFAGVLLSIAILPLLAPRLWHGHYGKITAAWALAFLLPFAVVHGWHAALANVVHALLAEYIPFVLLLTALFTVSGGIYLRGNLRGTPALNTAILALGTLLASLMGTTGASMLLIRPLLRANDDRKHRVHVVVFFIFLVSNIGGSLTPLGDPPLFLGFLKGVPFFWTMQHIWSETLFLVVALLVIFYLLDSWFYRTEGRSRFDPTPTDSESLRIEGGANFIWLAGIVVLVLMSGIWKPGITFDIMGTEVGLQSLLRDLGFACITLASLKLTARHIHESNQFNWEPMLEVAKLFAGIFLTIIPVIAMLQAGVHGPFAPVVRAVTGADGQPIPAMYFWATGVLSGFLDNAPTYLVFFNSAGGDAQTLTTTLAATLTGISAGAVFMGALSYIGNAPNLMVKAIAEHRGVPMPSFFGYVAWAVCILTPLFMLQTLLWYL
ncbi:sodium:proton antiporter [Vandammella animalimorsus]|uniref:Sodium:proton antiporter n=1 Tax=Vandammella animalimorsus TaxID=2029117 RepID=A0A2A2AWF2_9BURK|nr:sodium:proton antiporter [Vandammella animalimorsus]PAT42915.1 sodium:proton antiporter [Vandammella animalimorsus]